MKKILILFLLILFSFNKVYAVESSFAGREYLTGIAYTKYDGKTRYYRNAMAIMNNDTDQVAYCIEPFSLLIDNTNYFGGSAYYERFCISKSMWDRIKLYTYYGYGYYGHNDKKWISITQLSIWRELYPNYNFDWIDDVKSRNVIYPYNTEINELKNLVNRHYVIPSFEKSYNIGIGDKLVLIDQNNVLKDFEIIYSDFEYTKNDNNLTIQSKDYDFDGKITFRKNKDLFLDNVLFFYSESSQNLMQSGNLENIEFEININVNSGNIIVNKIDSESKDFISQGEASLDGSIFDLYDIDMNLVDSKIIKDNILMFEGLKYGKYYLKERKAGYGYYLNDKLYEVIIDNDHLENEIEIENEVIKSKVSITKYYGSKDEYNKGRMKKEADITFEIFDSNDNMIYSGVTNIDGKIEVELPYGRYILKQKNSTEGYELTEDYLIEINDDNSNYYDISLYDFKINTFNASFNIYERLSSAMRDLYNV